MALFLLIGMGKGMASTSNNQVFSTDNTEGKINAKSIEKAFNESGMAVLTHPFTVALYKKKGDDMVHIRYPSIDNWIEDLAIVDKEVIAEVKKTQAMIVGVLEELTE